MLYIFCHINCVRWIFSVLPYSTLLDSICVIKGLHCKRNISPKIEAASNCQGSISRHQFYVKVKLGFDVTGILEYESV